MKTNWKGPRSWKRLAAVTAIAIGVGSGVMGLADGAEAQRRAAAQSTDDGPNEAAAPARSRADTVTGHLNLNTATEEELVRLPGIGPAKAQAILAFRQRVRRFERVEDILRVRGIGRATFRELSPMLRVDGPTTLAGAAAPAASTASRPASTARAAATPTRR